jgi:hypothetical protein
MSSPGSAGADSCRCCSSCSRAASDTPSCSCKASAMRRCSAASAATMRTLSSASSTICSRARMASRSAHRSSSLALLHSAASACTCSSWPSRAGTWAANVSRSCRIASRSRLVSCNTCDWRFTCSLSPSSSPANLPMSFVSSFTLASAVCSAASVCFSSSGSRDSICRSAFTAVSRSAPASWSDAERRSQRCCNDVMTSRAPAAVRQPRGTDFASCRIARALRWTPHAIRRCDGEVGLSLHEAALIGARSPSVRADFLEAVALSRHERRSTLRRHGRANGALLFPTRRLASPSLPFRCYSLRRWVHPSVMQARSCMSGGAAAGLGEVRAACAFFNRA